MKTETLITGFIGILIGTMLPWLFFPWLGGMMGYKNSMMGSDFNTSDGNRISGAIDSHFIEQMIPHHEDAIFMADIALTKAKHSEIMELAQNIKETQSQEIEKMQIWYKDWYDENVPDVFISAGYGMGSGMMHMGMMGNSADIERLKNSSDFDKTFIEEMIPHHQMAVMMATMLEVATNRREMRQLAQDIIRAQTDEIDSMRSWYGEWYGQ